jgi:hypothetical protein
LAAPDGYRWCRGERLDATWHFLRAAELPPAGARPRSVKSVCGLWASVAPGAAGWAEVTERAAPARVCPACAAAVAEARRRARPAAPAAQARLL